MKTMEKTVDRRKKITRYWLLSFSIVLIFSIVLLAVFSPSSVRVQADNQILAIGDGSGTPAIKSPPTLDIVFNPTGTHIHKNYLKIRLDFYPNPGDKSYEKYRVNVIDENSQEFLAGYSGGFDKDGIPVDENNYQGWLDSLPRIWRVNPCLSHFVKVPPDITKEKLDVLVSDMFYQEVTATIDNAVIQTNSSHLLSPLMSDKSSSPEAYAASYENEELVINAVNTRLSGYSKTDNGEGESQYVEPQSIDVGANATDRSSGVEIETRTIFGDENPANDSGTITVVKVWLRNSSSNLTVGTVYEASDWSSRDYESVGSCASGSQQEFTGLDIDVESGDLIGACSADYAEIERDYSGDGYHIAASTFPFTDVSTADYGLRTISLYGTGTEGGGGSGISNAPSSENLGSVSANTTYYAYGSAPSNPVQEGDCTFTIENLGSTSLNINISATNFSGGSGWVITEGSPGINQARITAYYEGLYLANGVILMPSAKSFKTGLGPSEELMWDFSVEIGTFTDSEQKTSTITLTAVAP